jgi:hypothetical protein
MLMGENSHVVTRRLEERLNEIRATLPDNVDVQIMYKRTELVDRVIHTVKKNPLKALLVIAVLFAFLGACGPGSSCARDTAGHVVFFPACFSSGSPSLLASGRLTWLGGR